MCIYDVLVLVHLLEEISPKLEELPVVKVGKAIFEKCHDLSTSGIICFLLLESSFKPKVILSDG